MFEGVGPDVELHESLEAAVSAAQRGDDTAFRTVYRAVQPQLLNYVRSLVGPVDAEDVASEAWLQIARDLPNYRTGSGSIRGWAARIARNRALDHIRARSRRPVPGGGVDDLVHLPDRADTAGEALDAVATDRALAAIAALPREQAEAVLLRVVMGLDSTSAARVLGKRAGSVRMATHRGLRRLAEILEYDHGDLGEHRDLGGDLGGELGDLGAPADRADRGDRGDHRDLGEPGGRRQYGDGPGSVPEQRPADRSHADVTFSASKAL